MKPTVFLLHLLQLPKFSFNVHPAGGTTDIERTAVVATAVIMMPRLCCFTASLTTRQTLTAAH